MISSDIFPVPVKILKTIKKNHKIKCQGINKSYVKELIKSPDQEKWSFKLKSQTLGFLIFEPYACVGASGKHVVLHLICANKNENIKRFGTFMLVTFLRNMFRRGFRTVYLEAAGNKTARLATKSEQKLLCWYESFGFKKFYGTCSPENSMSHPIYQLKLRSEPTIMKLLKTCLWVKKTCRDFCEKRTKTKTELNNIPKSILISANQRRKLKYKGKSKQQLLNQLMIPRDLRVIDMRHILKGKIPNLYRLKRADLIKLF